MLNLLKKFIPSSRDIVMVAVMLAASVLLYFINLMPSPDASEGTKEKALVLSVDNSTIEGFFPLIRGSQLLQIKILSGKYKGKIFQANTEVRAQMELDKIFKPGDIVLAGIMHNGIAFVVNHSIIGGGF